jgi:hypothetical protein
MNKINIVLYDIHHSFLNKAEYVFRFFCEYLNIEPTFHYNHSNSLENEVIYSNKTIDIDNQVLYMLHQNIAADYFNNPFPITNLSYIDYEKAKIPVLFGKNKGKNILECYDIISSAFYFLSCFGEYIWEKEHPEAERYDYKDSLQYKFGFTEIPVVDYYLKIFEQALKSHFPHLIIKRKWQNTQIYLTHDIDNYDIWNKKHLREIYSHNIKRLKKQPINALYKLCGHFITKHFLYNPEKKLNKILLNEERKGKKSISFLIVDPEPNKEKQDYFYTNINAIKRIFKNRKIGLHGTNLSHLNEKKLQYQIDKLTSEGFEVEAYRSHYLRFLYHKSFRILDNCKLKYDSTLGYAEHIGFRAGTSLPFHPFDIINNKPFNIIEIPLIIMDATLYSPNSMDLNYHQARKKIQKIISVLDDVDGHLCVLWHNNTFDDIDYPCFTRLYNQLQQL